MNRSLRLFSVRGIDIRLHVTFPLILLWAAFQFGTLSGTLTSALFGVVAVSLLFVLVTLHELGHSFAAMHFGVPVKQIILSPIGGVAQLQRMPEKPIQEFIVAIAGPAVNVVMAVLMAMVGVALGLDLLNMQAVLGMSGITFAALFSYVFVYNIFLAVFNLIPAFPMDGGRVFRSLLAMWLDYGKATNIAATLGRIIAVLMGFYGLFGGSIFLVFIAVFIYMSASGEAAMVQQRQQLQGFTVQRAYSSSVVRLSPYSTLNEAMSAMLSNGQGDFPVVAGEQLVGFLTRDRLLEALQTRGPHTWVADVMRQDVMPVALHEDLFDVQQRFSEERIGALPVADSGRFLGLITARSVRQLYGLLRMGPNVMARPQSA